MGRSALILVIGMCIIFTMITPNINRSASTAYQNYLNYYSSETIHDLAESAANMAANAIFLNSSWRAGFTKSFGNGTYKVTVAKFVSDTNKLQVNAIANFMGTIDTITIILQPSSFAKFAYYSQMEGNIYWITGDTVWGPFHTEDVMQISGSPVFEGKVTAKGGTNPKKSSAKFYGGYQSGVSMTVPSDFNQVSAAATAGGKVVSSGDLYIQLVKDSIYWKTSSGGTYTHALLSTYAPNGVIYVASGNVHVLGTISGRATICANGTSGSTTKGNVYIDDNVQYNTDPRTNPASTDMLGIVSQNNVIITDNTVNRTDVTIQASLFSMTGGLMAENYDSRPVSGTINMFGGLSQLQRQPVGTFSGSGTLQSGFHKNYTYDNRFLVSSPPAFPNTGLFEVLSWKE